MEFIDCTRPEGAGSELQRVRIVSPTPLVASAVPPVAVAIAQTFDKIGVRSSELKIVAIRGVVSGPRETGILGALVGVTSARKVGPVSSKVV